MMVVLMVLLFLCIAAVGHAYVFYPLTLMWLGWCRRKEEVSAAGAEPVVSLIIAAYNEEKIIVERLENALALEYPHERLEILIASDGSDDATVALVEEVARRDERVRVLDFRNRRGKVNVLNDAVAVARGDFLIFSDANTFFRADVVKVLLGRFEDERTGCVCGRLIFEEGESGAVKAEGFYWKLETWMKEREGGRGSLLGANGAIFAMRKVLWEPCPADTLVEDFFMPMRLLQRGWRVFYEPRAIAVEESAPSLEDEFVRRVRIGAGGFQALSRLLPLLSPRYGFTSYAFFSHKVLRWMAPFFLVGAVILNLVLAVLGSVFFQVLLGMQVGFYVLAWVGLHWQPRGRMRVLLALPTQFVMMNLALLFGFVRWVTGSQRVTWKRTRRLSETTTS